MYDISLKPRTNEEVFLEKFDLLVCTRKKCGLFFLDKEPGLKASRTSFSTRKLARVYVQQGTLDKGIVCLPTNSCVLVTDVKKKYCQISRTHEQIKPVKENLFVVRSRK